MGTFLEDKMFFKISIQLLVLIAVVHTYTEPPPNYSDHGRDWIRTGTLYTISGLKRTAKDTLEDVVQIAKSDNANIGTAINHSFKSTFEEIMKVAQILSIGALSKEFDCNDAKKSMDNLLTILKEALSSVSSLISKLSDDAQTKIKKANDQRLFFYGRNSNTIVDFCNFIKGRMNSTGPIKSWLWLGVENRIESVVMSASGTLVQVKQIATDDDPVIGSKLDFSDPRTGGINWLRYMRVSASTGNLGITEAERIMMNFRAAWLQLISRMSPLISKLSKDAQGKINTAFGHVIFTSDSNVDKILEFLVLILNSNTKY